jgi:hypothetical protein
VTSLSVDNVDILLQNVYKIRTLQLANELDDAQPVLCQLLKHGFAVLSQTQLHKDKENLGRIACVAQTQPVGIHISLLQ